MSIPTPVERKLAHTRTVSFQGFERSDGLWDIEAEMMDTKPFAFDLSDRHRLEAGQPVHHMHIRITIDHRLIVQDIHTSMQAYPHSVCIKADQHMRKMIGCTMMKGWRKSIETHLGGIEGCTHMRELLFNMATAAFQTLAPKALASYRTPSENPNRPPPPHLGGCMTWDFKGPTVKAIYPVYFDWPNRTK
ncbi:DUF2889 domain-containing protein [Lampropedia puyangensis]|uniref:DUF2889 domain-containing protein n=1 Tax=Lampropedia puyangensis TaxID=1330072 RepID=A0A4S8FAD9_9BURK|nr:DUF2889 domain-containing protein [Lampropedia puyangensis]THU02552.1 DUF2889 domain-containing protein [Lampropedia puyangensis]